MPGFVVTTGAVLTCPHGGTVSFVPAGPPRVLVGGTPVVTAADQIVVAGCAAQPTLCVTVKWANVDARVVTNGTPILLQAPPPVPPPVPGNGLCIGSATPVAPLVMALAPRVTGG